MDVRTLTVWVLGGIVSALFASGIRLFSHLSLSASVPWLAYLIAAGMTTIGLWFFMRPRPLVVWEAFVSIASIFGVAYLLLHLLPIGVAILVGSIFILSVFLSEWWLSHALLLFFGGIGIALNMSHWSPDLSILAGLGILVVGYALWDNDQTADVFLMDAMVERHVYPCIFIPSSRSQWNASIPDLHSPSAIGLGSLIPLWIVASWEGWTSWQMGILLTLLSLAVLAGIRRFTDRGRFQLLLVMSVFLSFAGVRILSHVW